MLRPDVFKHAGCCHSWFLSKAKALLIHVLKIREIQIVPFFCHGLHELTRLPTEASAQAGITYTICAGMTKEMATDALTLSGLNK